MNTPAGRQRTKTLPSPRDGIVAKWLRTGELRLIWQKSVCAVARILNRKDAKALSHSEEFGPDDLSAFSAIHWV
jgi:hypothetical protein